MTSTNSFVSRYEVNNRFEFKFLRIQTFFTSDTKAIFNLNNKLYFDNFGNVSVQNTAGNLEVEYSNPATPGKSMAYNIDSNLVGVDRRKDKDGEPYPLIFSPNLQWMLYKAVYTKEDIKKLPEDFSSIQPGEYTYLLFNFFHTEDFTQYYKSSSANAMNLFNNYCKSTFDLDPTCSCLPINSEICVRRLLPASMVDSQKGTSTYNAFTTICQHVEQGCQSITAYPTSFLNQYYKDFPRPPSVNVTLCAQSFTAGGNIALKKGEIQQQCSSGGAESIGAVLVSQVNTPKPQDTGTSGSDGTTGDNQDTSTTAAEANQSFIDKYVTTTNILILVGIVVVLAGIAYFTLRKKSSPESVQVPVAQAPVAQAPVAQAPV